MGPEFLVKAWGFLFIKLNLTLITVGRAEASGADVMGSSHFSYGVWVMGLDLGLNSSSHASWLCGLGQMTQSF